MLLEDIMKGKKLTKYAPLAVVALLAASCGGGDNVVDKSLETGPGYAASRRVFDNFMASDALYKEVAFTNHGQGFFPSFGKPKLVVVPCVYSDDNQSADTITELEGSLQRAFFGAPEETAWHSVKSFYYADSYGMCDLEGIVVKTIKLDKTYSEMNAADEHNFAIEEIFDKVFGEGGQLAGKESEYDDNKDGVIDGIYCVPLNSKVNNPDTFGWAWTTNHYFSSALIARSKAKYQAIGTWCWTSSLFMTRVAGGKGSITKPDSHTFIHEMGHQFGLNDYYDPSNQGSSTAGGGSMQDQNIGAHDIYSRYLLGWANPQVVTDENKEATITINLKPSDSTGDFLLLASGYNGTALDEYIAVELYTPTGLNKADSESSYESKDQILPNEPGLRIWHVDKNIHEAHLVRTRDANNKVVWTTYFDPNPASKVNTLGKDKGYAFPDDVAPEDDDIPDQNDTYYTTFTTNNSENYSNAGDAAENFYIKPELQILRADKGTATPSATITNTTLFKEGATFGAAGDVFNGFEFYSPIGVLDYDTPADAWNSAPKHKLPYSIKIDSLNGEGAKLTLTKLS